MCTVRNIPNRIGKTASKIEKEILKNIGRLIVHLLDYAGCDYCLHCCFINNGKEMDKELKRTVDTAIVLVCCCRESFLTPAFSVMRIAVDKNVNTAASFTVEIGFLVI